MFRSVSVIKEVPNDGKISLKIPNDAPGMHGFEECELNKDYTRIETEQEIIERHNKAKIRSSQWGMPLKNFLIIVFLMEIQNANHRKARRKVSLENFDAHSPHLWFLLVT